MRSIGIFRTTGVSGVQWWRSLVMARVRVRGDGSAAIDKVTVSGSGIRRCAIAIGELMRGDDAADVMARNGVKVTIEAQRHVRMNACDERRVKA